MTTPNGVRQLVVEVIAGGIGSRLQGLIDAEYRGLPKHLLPLPSRGRRSTILGNVVEDTLEAFGTARVHVRSETMPVFTDALIGFGDAVHVLPDTRLSGPLGPIAAVMRETAASVYMAGGDVYCAFTWSDLLRYHASHPLPVTALFAPPVQETAGARIRTTHDGGWSRAITWERCEHITPRELHNIGMYVFDPAWAVAEVFATVARHTEDAILGPLVEAGLVAAYVVPGPGFNVNTPEIYDRLRRHLESGQGGR
jgi:NDP-sugar pyrophosphorylase family protein